MKTMIVLFSSLFLTFVLNGCATVKETYSQDGRKAYTLNCSGSARGWDKCYVAAGELCKTKGYDIMDRSSDAGFAIGGTNNSIAGATTNERSMLVACKK
tara:strand:+ start:134 stop:430 length:297 start_codon:yes stop_codon:yes gene_type:complete